MRGLHRLVIAVLLTLGLVAPAWATTSVIKRTITTGRGSVASVAALTTSLVAQGSGDTGTPAELVFEGTTNAFRDSGEAIKVEFNTNLAGPRLLIYTNNLATTANPKAEVNTALGVDGGGLVGMSNKAQTVPMLWFSADTNVNHNFTPTTLPQIGASNGIFIVDTAHVATFTAKNGPLDNLQMERCENGVAVENTVNDGLYPQFFGGGATREDLCRQDTGAEIPEAQELSKNIAVLAHSLNGSVGLSPNVATPSSEDTITVNSPFFVALGADFRLAPAQDYQTSTLTVELVTQ